MSDARIALLPDRGVVAVTGEDARKLLQGIVTNDMDLLDKQPAIFAGLLSPQGKVLFDFYISLVPTGYLLDVAHDMAADLAKRLLMYRLRAKAAIEDLSSRSSVVVVFGEMRDLPVEREQSFFADPRSVRLGARAILPIPQARLDEFAAWGPTGEHAAIEHAPSYHAYRIALGIPEGGKDWDFGDTFPHEANFDLLNGVSFEKGCYVGQEIVARMEHRGTVRKRIVRVTGAAALPANRPEIKMGDAVIGKLGSVSGRLGLAMLRLDRAIEAIDKGTPITSDGITLDVDTAMIDRQRKLMAEKAASP